MEDKNIKDEQLLIDMKEDLKRKDKIIWISMWVIILISLMFLFTGLIVVTFLIPEGIWQAIVVFGICILFMIPCLYALKLEVSVGTYKCKDCGHEIVPKYKDAMMAMHMHTTRYLKCPNCNKATWHKKNLTFKN